MLGLSDAQNKGYGHQRRLTKGRSPAYIMFTMRLTFSKLDTYSKCPLRFQLRYQEKLPEAPRGGRNLSLILHKALEAFLLNAPRDSSLATLLRGYENRCAPPETPAQVKRFQEGRHALESFHWREGHRLAGEVLSYRSLENSFLVSYPQSLGRGMLAISANC